MTNGEPLLRLEQGLPYRNHLARIAARYTTDVDDVLQEVHLYAWQYLSKGNELRDGEQGVKKWLSYITYLEALSHWRKQQRTSTKDERGAYLYERQGHTDFDSAILVQQLKNQLTGKQRVAVDLRYQQGFTYEEIGRWLGINTKTAYDLVGRALERCSSYLQD